MLAVLTDKYIVLTSGACPRIIAANYSSINLKGGFILAENNTGISIFSINSCAEIVGTNNKPGKPAFYPPYFAFSEDRSFRIFRMDSTTELLSGDLRMPILYTMLDDGFAVFVLKENIVTLDFINKRFTGLKPLPADFSDAHIEGGWLNGFGKDRFYSINYQNMHRGGELEILDYPNDNMTDCVKVSGSADAYCGGRFVAAGIEAGLPSEKTAIVDGFTLHLNKGELTALATDASLRKEIIMNREPFAFCSSENTVCMNDIDGNRYCTRDNAAEKVDGFPEDCGEAYFNNGSIEDGEGNILLKFAEEVNSSDNYIMWRRTLEDGIYYFFTEK